ncbi:hypothetical protein [Kitasatospora sp. NPDC059673]|uniref:hypothetical protein n=1 Tax=Kitasatospora sp. NPDC059673 TaxID=3346901 RepID=UPI00368BBCCD
MRQLARRAAQIAAVLAALAATSGCTVPSDAVAGISVTEDGHPLGVLLVCGDRIDGATLYTSEGSHEETIGTWTAHSALRPGLTTWTLDAPAEGWETGKSAAPLDAGTTYHLYGWTKDNSRSSTHVDFTPEDLEQLTPGNVRYHRTASDGSTSTSTVPVAEFQAKACKH